MTLVSVSSVGLPSRRKALYIVSRVSPASFAICVMPRAGNVADHSGNQRRIAILKRGFKVGALGFRRR
jgi:predicted deacetylase